VYLLSMTIENFRSYKERKVLKIGDFTAIMGRNDVGKSTLLEALEIFFNNQITKIEQADLCVHTRLNSGAAARMTIDQIRQTDQNSEILGWLNAVTERLS
jgi:AAA15 family ATPase/GTPase